MIHETWQAKQVLGISKVWREKKLVFAKKLMAGLVDRLQNSIQGEPVKSKEIADLVRQEFNLPTNVVVPIKSIKQDPNFIINNYSKIMELTQKDVKKTWEILVPNKKLDVEENKFQLNDDDLRFFNRLETTIKTLPPMQGNTGPTKMEKFVDWVKQKGYASNTEQSLHEVYDWYMAEEVAKKRQKGLTWGPLFQQERTYFPYTPSTDKIQVPWALESYLLRNGYQIVDYKQGLVQNAKTGREIGIGKILKNSDREDFKEMFINRLQGGIKSEQPHFIVFSHKPEDIAGMSTDRGWTSCLTLRPEELKNYGAAGFMHGDENKYVFNKIAKGGMVVYLVRADDKDIEHPLARIDLRRYEDAYGDFIFVWGDICYGIHDKGFEDFVRNKVKESNSITTNEIKNSFVDAEEPDKEQWKRSWDFPYDIKSEESKKYVVSNNKIYQTWKKNVFAKKIFSSLKNRLVDMENGEKVKSKEIADLVRQEFNLKNDISIPVSIIKQNPQFIIDNYDTLLEYSKNRPNEVWNNLVPRQDIKQIEDKKWQKYFSTPALMGKPCKYGDQTITINGETMQIVALDDAGARYQEGQTMQHCLGGSQKHSRNINRGVEEVYSLRDMNNVSYATIALYRGTLWQVCGKRHAKPDNKYINFIKKWIENNGIKIGDENPLLRQIMNLPEEEKKKNFILNLFSKK